MRTWARHGSLAALEGETHAAGRTTPRVDGTVSLRVPLERANCVSAHEERLKRSGLKADSAGILKRRCERVGLLLLYRCLLPSFAPCR